jgi:glycine cleavage system regulatory protein
MIPLVLTYVGDDRPGLVSAVSEKIAAFGGTWLESRSARLAGKFAGILLVEVPEANVSALERALRGLSPAGLNLTIERGAHEPSEPPARMITLDILGNERPGIVRDVTQALSALGVNIEEFESGLESAAFTGIEMFRAHARLRAPEALSLEELRKGLERLAGEIMVDLTFGEPDRRA